MFKARAVALRGSVRKPYFQELGEHAALSTYAGSAGHATARNERFVLGARDLAYDAASSEIHAFLDDGLYRTVVETTLENFSALNGRIAADRIVARLESVYDPREYPGRKAPRILPHGSRFENLRVNGQQVRPKLPAAFNLEEDQREEFFAGRCADDSSRHPGFIPESFHIENMGTIFLAEWTWVHPQERHEQHLTMLRLALGSDTGADVHGASANSDGSGWPA